MDVSVVIVSFNVADFLEECLSSIKKETTCEYEIIIVDNNSNDNSVEIVERYHPEVNLIKQDVNAGFAKANNIGFKEARCRYVFMLNPDTVVLENAIDKLVQFMDGHQEAGACGPKNLNPDLSLQHNCHHFPSLSMRLIHHLQLERFFPKHRFFGREFMTYWDYGEIKEVDWITGCSLMIRKDVLEEAGYLDENYFMYAEECDFCLKIRKQGWRTVFFPKAAIIHYGGQSALGQTDEKVFNKSISSHLFTTRYYFFRKNHGYLSCVAYKCIDFLYYSIVYLKNLFRWDKEIRKSKLDEARTVLSIILSSR